MCQTQSRHSSDAVTTAYEARSSAQCRPTKTSQGVFATSFGMKAPFSHFTIGFESSRRDEDQRIVLAALRFRVFS
jgi:hypothetical protein